MLFRKHLSGWGPSTNVEVTTMHTPPMFLDFTVEAITLLLSHAAI
jgi:hypothetical protein